MAWISPMSTFIDLACRNKNTKKAKSVANELQRNTVHHINTRQFINLLRAPKEKHNATMAVQTWFLTSESQIWHRTSIAYLFSKRRITNLDARCMVYLPPKLAVHVGKKRPASWSVWETESIKIPSNTACDPYLPCSLRMKTLRKTTQIWSWMEYITNPISSTLQPL